ncbi:MAG: alpha/beta hydrolase [Cyanobacteria bacterium]|nr:alpha/beta hydrolase [Cyanobacteriota bacterium]
MRKSVNQSCQRRWGDRLKGFAIALVGASTLAVAGASSASALERVEVRYGPLGVSTSLEDLQAFAAGEETSSSFRAVLRMMDNYGGISGDTFRTLLTQEVNLGMLGIDSKVMYGFVGRRVLERVANLIYPPNDRGNMFALRGALALALADDGKLSALEVLEHYGPHTMRIDAAGIQGSIEEFKELLDQL